MAAESWSSPRIPFAFLFYGRAGIRAINKFCLYTYRFSFFFQNHFSYFECWWQILDCTKEGHNVGPTCVYPSFWLRMHLFPFFFMKCIGFVSFLWSRSGVPDQGNCYYPIGEHRKVQPLSCTVTRSRRKPRWRTVPPVSILWFITSFSLQLNKENFELFSPVQTFRIFKYLQNVQPLNPYTESFPFLWCLGDCRWFCPVLWLH